MASSSESIPSSGSSSQTMTSSPCAACKFLRRKCQPECVFAPYFPPDNQQKFVNVHRIFGASNVTKLLNELQPYQREDAVNSLAYEADMRLQDPVYGCVRIISMLQHQLRQLQMDLSRAKAELFKFQSAAASAAAVAGAPPANFGVTGPSPATTATGHMFININQPIGLTGNGLGHDQFYQSPAAADLKPHNHMMPRNYDADLAGRLDTNHGYEAGINGAVTGTATFGGLFMKPSKAAGEKRSGNGPL